LLLTVELPNATVGSIGKVFIFVAVTSYSEDYFF